MGAGVYLTRSLLHFDVFPRFPTNKDPPMSTELHVVFEQARLRVWAVEARELDGYSVVAQLSPTQERARASSIRISIKGPFHEVVTAIAIGVDTVTRMVNLGHERARIVVIAE